MKSKKCFSRCRKVPEDICKDKTRLCQFTKGTRKYCRISKLYKMDKNCNMVKKIKKLSSKQASTKIGDFILNVTKRHREKKQNQRLIIEKQANASKKIGDFILNVTKRHRENEQKIKDKQAASNKIAKFMFNTEAKRKAFFLKTICSDSGACLAFGTEINKINKFFNDFTNFDYAVSPIKQIGAVSANGFVKEIKYSREGYDAYTVLKSSINVDSDNLMYEYEVGKFVNKKAKVFPCFLETYGLFFYNGDADWKHCKDTHTITSDVLKNSMVLYNKINYRNGCKFSKYVSILIQHVKNPLSFDNFIENTVKEVKIKTTTNVMNQYNLINFEMLYILYQIYMPLSTLHDVFTHYDLHADNVLLYEPSKDSYINYNYHLDSGVIVKFKSKYIAKIIDYGRSYYYEDAATNSKNTYDSICKIKECEPNCGEDNGLNILGPEDPPGSFYYISSQKSNISLDVRLLKIVSEKFLYHSNSRPEVNTLLNIVNFTGSFGTKQVKRSGLPHSINNVIDVCDKIEEIITNPSYILHNDNYYSHLTKIGDFHIYQNGQPMKFIKT